MSDWHEQKRKAAKEQKDAENRMARNIVIAAIVVLLLVGGIWGYSNR